MLRSRHVGVAHAEVDDIRTARTRSRFQAVDFRENVWRQALDTVKIFAQQSLPSMP
jgi:hypothetical protein